MGEVKVFCRPRKTQRTQLIQLQFQCPILHFLVAFFFYVKTSQNLHMKMSSVYRFIFMQIETYFHKKGFARGLVLKLRHVVTWRWFINLCKEQLQELDEGPVSRSPENFPLGMPQQNLKRCHHRAVLFTYS